MSLDILNQIPFPTIDRPFGIHLWPIFDRAFSAVVGFSPDEFRFVGGVTPMSTLKETATALTTYYVIVFGGREIMKKFPALKLNGLFMIHNLYLTAISGILLALFIEQLLPTLWRNGLFYAICNHDGGWTRQLVILYYVRNMSYMALDSMHAYYQNSSTTSPSLLSCSTLSSSFSRRSP
jgi:GNS1/SUR4 family